MKKTLHILLMSILALGLCKCSYFIKKPTAKLEFVLGADLGDLLRNMSGDSQDSLFNTAISQADNLSKTGKKTFIEELSLIYGDKNTEGKLAIVFSLLPKYTNDIHINDANKTVIKYLNTALKSELDKMSDILKKRIDLSGVSDKPDVKIDYNKGVITVHVNVYDKSDIAVLEKMMITQGNFEMWDTYENQELIYGLIEADKALGAMLIKDGDMDETNDHYNAGRSLGLPDSIIKKSTAISKMQRDSSKMNPLLKILYLRADNQNGIYPGPAIGVSFGKDTPKVNRYMGTARARILFPRDVRFLWAAKPTNSNDVYELYAIKINPARHGPPIDGTVITDARQGYDLDKKPDLTLSMNSLGASQWEIMTAAAANSSMMVNGHSTPTKRCIAIVIDNRVFSAPRVQNKITGGNTQITGIGDVNEAMQLATILRSGGIKCRLHLASEKVLPIED